MNSLHQYTQGGKLSLLPDFALKLIPPPHQRIGSTHVYVMGGIPDITIKLNSYINRKKYTECIYTETPEITTTRIKQEIENCSHKIIQAGAIPSFATITSCDIAKYNRSLLTKRKTFHLAHTSHYISMQSNLEQALREINKFILDTNQRNNMSTPFCHTAIRKRRGTGKGYYKFMYDNLYDGVHGTDEIKGKWADAIKGAIRNNRGQGKRKKGEEDQDENTKSPRRSWRREKRGCLAKSANC